VGAEHGSISPGSMRKPRTFDLVVDPAEDSTLPSLSQRARSPAR